jgi:glucose/arabinose dehydrogenase
MYSTEFGEMGGDELNIIKPGANYGWPQYTFSLEYTGKPIKELKDSIGAGIQTPVGHWTIAPGDVEVVNGTRYPGWDGNVFIGAMSKTMPLLLRAVVKNGVLVHDETMLENIGRVREVKYGPDQFLYLATEDTGLLVRLVPVVKK